MWHLVSREAGLAIATATEEPQTLWDPPVVCYIRTWLDVSLNATTCRRSGPTQEASLGLSKARDKSPLHWPYLRDPCRLGWAWCSGGVTAFRLPSHVKQSTATHLHSLLSTISFHSNSPTPHQSLTHSLTHSLAHACT